MMTKKQDSVRFAWKVHDQIEASIGRVDNKASIILVIETALVGLAFSQSASPGRFSNLIGANLAWSRAGYFFLIVSIIASLSVVLPHLGRKRKLSKAPTMIYFGHIVKLEEGQVLEALSNGIDELAQLAIQMEALSKIAWRKHFMLRCSIFSLGASVFSIFFALSC